MAARDAFHNAVKQGLIKDGWTITHDPLAIEFGDVDMSVDLGAEKLIGAEKNQQKIAVEVKSFLGLSAIYEFHLALGQFLNYRIALRELEPERKLYLAVPNDTYATFFSLRLPQVVSKDLALTYIIYEPKKEVIEQWIS